MSSFDHSSACRLIPLSLVAISGTGSKTSQWIFVPSTHPGTRKLVLSTAKQYTKVLKNFFNFYFFISDPRKYVPMLLCVDLIQLYSPSQFVAEMCMT